VRDKDRPTIVLQPTWDQLDEITLGSVVSPEYQRAAREERIGDFATLALRMEHGPPSGSFMSASGTDWWCWPPVSVSAVGTGVAADSSLEEAGFELPVPLAIGALRTPKIAREL